MTPLVHPDDHEDVRAHYVRQEAPRLAAAHERAAAEPARAAVARWRERHPARYEWMSRLRPVPLSLLEVDMTDDHLRLLVRQADEDEVRRRLLAGEPFTSLFP